jgi:protein O-GlcNAc transferase
MSQRVPSSPDQYQLAVQLYSSDRFAEALTTIEQQIYSRSGNRQQWEVLNLAAACALAMRKYGDAEAYWLCAIQEKPDYADAHSNLGILFKELKRLSEAEAAYQQALAIDPDHADAHSNLGVLLHELGRWPEAEAACHRAICIRPNFAEAYYNLGRVLKQLNRLREAEDAYRHALKLRPGYAEAYNNLGILLYELDQCSEAQAACERAIEIRPDFAEAHYNLGRLLQKSNRLPEAEAVYARALAICPDYAMVYNNLGKVLQDSGALDEGIACYRHAVSLDPDNVIAHSNLAYSLTFQSEDGEDARAECRRWSARHEARLRWARLPLLNDRTVGRRLRIGYVSADFREHCQSLFTVPLLSHHDHERFEIHCYASVERPDGMTRCIAGYADVWHEVRGMDDERLAQQIRTDGIDILVDLAMHMADGRPLLFCRKPAPVQVAWLAYPGTTGIDAIDYRLTDPRLDPSSCDGRYSECSLHLPDSYWCYDPLTDEPAVNLLPALNAGHITFGCLNNPCKLTDRTLGMWADVLREVKDATLLLMAITGVPSERLTRRIGRQGIDLQRVRFVPFRPRADYLRTYHAIDIGLDTFPYNGHTTSLDSFWMGVPIVTRVGKAAVGRAGLSQLFNLGLSELAAHTDEEFVRIAVELATDLPRLARLRQGLRLRMEPSALMDAPRFAKHIESVYRQVWHNWCRQKEVKSVSPSICGLRAGSCCPT